MTQTSQTQPLLDVQNLSVSFTQYTTGMRQHQLEVITDLSIAIEAGKIVAVVGSSGSGKSLLAHAILGILPSNAKVAGTMRYDGSELTAQRQVALRGKEITIIPQSVNFLDPLMQVGPQVRHAVQQGDPKTEQRRVFARYQLAADVEKLYPFQVS
ncbi:MAG: ATP-binding cassette domain-containing protein, partial [Firmicutes bacterium]|nr:ATP-binding cassette domain-containing protein [Bacillota bacterium]